MSLIFSILQKDYMVFAADSRHTRGDGTGNFYKNDQAIKTVEIMRGDAVFGFAGRDWGESITAVAKTKGYLDSGSNLEEISQNFCKFAREEYDAQFGIIEPANYRPVVEFMFTGWIKDYAGQSVATTHTFRLPDQASYSPYEFPYRTFHAIGKSCHGALYALHRFANQNLPLDAALRLAVFTLTEICEQDTSVGGGPVIYTLNPGEKVQKLNTEKLNSLTETAKAAGESLRQFLQIPSG